MALSPAYSSAVLQGVRKHGMTEPAICQLTGLSSTDLRRILQEKAALKVRQIESIERATGLTAGQLAVKSDKAASRSLGGLMDQWAMATPPATSRRGRPARKPG